MNSTKAFLFDTIFLTYALLLTVGLIARPGEDFAEAHMGEIALVLHALHEDRTDHAAPTNQTY